MAALAIGLVWAGYTTVLYGYCLFRGYNITPKQLLSPTWPPGSTAAKPAAPEPPNSAAGESGFGPSGNAGGGGGGGGGGSF